MGMYWSSVMCVFQRKKCRNSVSSFLKEQEQTISIKKKQTISINPTVRPLEERLCIVKFILTAVYMGFTARQIQGGFPTIVIYERTGYKTTHAKEYQGRTNDS